MTVDKDTSEGEDGPKKNKSQAVGSDVAERVS